MLISTRVASPLLITWYVNRTLDRDPLYSGRIDRVSLSLWRGAYTIHGMRFDKRDGNLPRQAIQEALATPRPAP